MKKFFYILLFTIIACSPDNDFAILENQSTSPETYNLESVKQSTANVFNTETFENKKLDINPTLGDFNPEFAVDHSFSLSNNIKREGNSAGRFQINKKDPKTKGTTMAELSQAKSTAQAEGWYGFSQYFPETYVPDSSEEIITQWQDQSVKGGGGNGSPSNAIITVDDKVQWMVQKDADANNSTDYIDLGTIPKNIWIDWVVHIKYSQTNTGILEVWMDGKKVIDRQNMSNSYNDAAYPYLKFGLYKEKWGPSTSERVIYFDEVKIGDSNSNYDEIKPGGSQALVPSETVSSEPAPSEPVMTEYPIGATEISTVDELIAGLKSDRNLYLKPGNYILPNTLVLNNLSNLKVTGANGAVIKGNLQTLLRFNGTANSISFNNIVFNSTSTYTSSDGGAGIVYFDGSVEDLLFENCEFTCPNVVSNGLKIVSENASRSKNITINNCYFHDIGRMALETQNHNNDGIMRITDVTVTNCQFNRMGLQSPYGMAISLSGSGQNALLDNNNIVDSKDRGIENVGWSNITITNNTFSSPNTDFDLITCQTDYANGAPYLYNVVINGNSGTVTGNNHLVTISYSDGAKFFNNDFNADALVLYSTINSEFYDNTYYSDGSIGLYIESNSNNNSFHDNTFATTADNANTVVIYAPSSGNVLTNNILLNQGSGGGLYNDYDGGNTLN
ncbi:MAG: heparin lyase I family protein [Gillisia sp.]|nr:heparin lyase I family protein [Gillisia sp.]